MHLVRRWCKSLFYLYVNLLPWVLCAHEWNFQFTHMSILFFSLKLGHWTNWHFRLCKRNLLKAMLKELLKIDWVFWRYFAFDQSEKEFNCNFCYFLSSQYLLQERYMSWWQNQGKLVKSGGVIRNMSIGHEMPLHHSCTDRRSSWKDHFSLLMFVNILLIYFNQQEYFCAYELPISLIHCIHALYNV